MKRDFDLIRDILLEVEKWDQSEALRAHKLSFDGKTSEEIIYHAKLLIEDGYVEGHLFNSSAFILPVDANLNCLTMKGHDFLDNARNETVWVKTKEEAAKVSSSISLDMLKLLLEAAMKSLFFPH